MNQDYFYHGIIIQEGFRDQNILHSFTILGKKQGKLWTLLKVSIEPTKLEHFVEIVKNNLLLDEN